MSADREQGVSFGKLEGEILGFIAQSAPVAVRAHIENTRPLRAGVVRLFDRFFGCYLSSK
jgi:hypothetical protein